MGGAENGVSTKGLSPLVPVAGWVEQALRGNDPPWQCGCKAKRMLSLKVQLLSVKATKLEALGRLSKAILYELLANRKIEAKEKNKAEGTNNQKINVHNGL